MSQRKFEYKGYTATVSHVTEEKVFFGTVNGTKDVITFEAPEAAGEEGLEAEFKTSVDDYLEMCASRGEEPNIPART